MTKTLYVDPALGPHDFTTVMLYQEDEPHGHRLLKTLRAPAGFSMAEQVRWVHRLAQEHGASVKIETNGIGGAFRAEYALVDLGAAA